MRVLAIDTTASFGSIALLNDDRIAEEMLLHAPEGFSSTLFEQIRKLLGRHNVSVSDIGCFASASGPGSFTGVRIGLTAVKSLAEATGARAMGISNLQTLAYFGTTSLRGTLIDARRGEVYGAVYGDDLRIVIPEAVLPFPAWTASLPGDVTEWICTDATPFRNVLPPGVSVIERRALASAVGILAQARLRDGESGDPAGVDANYVRRSDAELNWTDDSPGRPAGIAEH